MFLSINLMTKKTYVSLTPPSQAGSNSDPKGYEGLAHYTEHAIFSGSVNFPSAGYLVKFAERNDGYRNAATWAHTTNYLMQIDPDQLNKGMEVMSDMFKNPLFNANVGH